MTGEAPSVAIIGAGFSGLLTAIHLLRSHPGLRVSLIEREGAFGPGTAYATSNPDHVLNVRLGNMSAFPDLPDHLAQWLAARPSWRARDGFITRGDYGAYLASLLQEAQEDPLTGRRLSLRAGDVTRIERTGARWTLRFERGAPLTADTVVLAIGNMEPAPLHGLHPALADSPAYIADPWRAAATIPETARKIMLVGTGLTMVDTILTLARVGRRFTAISRRGLLPQSHALGPQTAKAPDLPADLRGALRAVRLAADSGNWRGVMDQVRHTARTQWQGWSAEERARFLRHLRPFWDIHRHRLAPSVANQLEEFLRSGALMVEAGRLITLEPEGTKVRVHWRPRGQKTNRALLYDAVVNCTGPLGSLDQSRSPLIRNLLADGLLTPDPNGLGARVGPCCGLLASNGTVQPGLFGVGPITRGAFWEMTSVPDLRVQARDVAQAIAASLPTA